MSLSFSESPQLSTTMHVDPSNLGAIFIASANACAGSRLGEISSRSLTNLKASRASSSVADVYLALPLSFKKQCIGLTEG